MLKHLYEKYFALTLTCPSGLGNTFEIVLKVFWNTLKNILKYFENTLLSPWPVPLAFASGHSRCQLRWVGQRASPRHPSQKHPVCTKQNQYSVYHIRYIGNQYSIFGIWYSVLGISQRASPRHPSQQHPAQSKIGIWSLKLSVQYFVFNFRFLVFSIGQRARPRHPSQKPPAQKGKSVFGIRYFGIQYWSKSLHFSKKSWTKKQNLLSVFKKSSALLFFPGSKTWIQVNFKT